MGSSDCTIGGSWRSTAVIGTVDVIGLAVDADRAAAQRAHVVADATPDVERRAGIADQLIEGARAVAAAYLSSLIRPS